MLNFTSACLAILARQYYAKLYFRESVRERRKLKRALNFAKFNFNLILILISTKLLSFLYKLKQMNMIDSLLDMFQCKILEK